MPAVQHRRQKDGAIAAEISLCTTKVIKNRLNSYKTCHCRRWEERRGGSPGDVDENFPLIHRIKLFTFPSHTCVGKVEYRNIK